VTSDVVVGSRPSASSDDDEAGASGASGAPLDALGARAGRGGGGGGARPSAATGWTAASASNWRHSMPLALSSATMCRLKAARSAVVSVSDLAAARSGKVGW
jgi:hypothetical protein